MSDIENQMRVLQAEAVQAREEKHDVTIQAEQLAKEKYELSVEMNGKADEIKAYIKVILDDGYLKLTE